VEIRICDTQPHVELAAQLAAYVEDASRRISSQTGRNDDPLTVYRVYGYNRFQALPLPASRSWGSHEAHANATAR